MKTLIIALLVAMFFSFALAWQQEYYEGRLIDQASKGSGDWSLDVKPGLFDNGIRFEDGEWKPIRPMTDAGYEEPTFK